MTILWCLLIWLGLAEPQADQPMNPPAMEEQFGRGDEGSGPWP